ncbi:MAG TPA: hypothetical protein VM736_04770, partial [Gemmatimonadales bacterium]|nr:hypothetical protein [Gemmatimonadales bacterium]
SYVSRYLAWFRSTLAHNAPRVDGTSQPPGNAVCEACDAASEWTWVRGRYGELVRTVVSGATYVLDVVELGSRTEHVLELPWHFAGTARVAGRGGTWAADDLPDGFVSRPERFAPATPGAITLELAAGPRRLTALLLVEGELLRAEGPGRPGEGQRMPFYLVRAKGRAARLIAVLEPVAPERDAAFVTDVRAHGGVIEVVTPEGPHRHTATSAGWEIAAGPTRVRLGGARTPEPAFTPLVELDQPKPPVVAALRVAEPPPLDGTLDGFDPSEPFRLELEDQYRRSEEPYSGPEDFSAVAYAAWDEAALYLAVEVAKPDVCFRAANAPPLALDNEPDDIHSDGIQIYLARLEPRGKDDASDAYLVVPVPDGRGLRVRRVTNALGDPDKVRGAWRRTDAGYRLTLGVPWPEDERPHVGGRLRFDLLINEMVPGRVRRAGQLVWTGGNGWVWLRGDRQEPARLGMLELVG